jgi:hypothetical protein
MVSERILETYKLTLMGSGISIDREIDQATAERVVQVVFGAHQIRELQPPHGPDRPVDERRPSLREVFEEAEARTIPEKIVVIGAYLRDQQIQASFTREDNKVKFKTAGEPVPANYPRDFNKAIQAGWIAEDHQNPGHFYITRRGDETLSRRFENRTIPTTRSPRRRQNRVVSDPIAGDVS